MGGKGGVSSGKIWLSACGPPVEMPITKQPDPWLAGDPATAGAPGVGGEPAADPAIAGDPDVVGKPVAGSAVRRVGG